MTIHTCICGYTKDEGGEYKDVTEYYTRGAKAGQVKNVERKYVLNEPDKPSFIPVEIKLEIVQM